MGCSSSSGPRTTCRKSSVLKSRISSGAGAVRRRPASTSPIAALTRSAVQRGIRGIRGDASVARRGRRRRCRALRPLAPDERVVHDTLDRGAVAVPRPARQSWLGLRGRLLALLGAEVALLRRRGDCASRDVGALNTPALFQDARAVPLAARYVGGFPGARACGRCAAGSAPVRAGPVGSVCVSQGPMEQWRATRRRPDPPPWDRMALPGLQI